MVCVIVIEPVAEHLPATALTVNREILVFDRGVWSYNSKCINSYPYLTGFLLVSESYLGSLLIITKLFVIWYENDGKVQRGS